MVHALSGTTRTGRTYSVRQAAESGFLKLSGNFVWKNFSCICICKAATLSKTWFYKKPKVISYTSKENLNSTLSLLLN